MRYFEEVRKILDWAERTQAEVIHQVADRMAEAISHDQMVYVFGCSHASILAAETFYRAGGLAAISPIFAPGLTVDVRPMNRTSRLERLPGFGSLILADVPLAEGDVFLVISVSGRNTVPVEMALEGRARGATVVAVTSVVYSQTVTSRHPSGQRLFEVADWVLDLGGVPGDAIVTFEGLDQAVGPSSTVVGTALLNALICETVDRLLKAGETPPIFLSANLDGGDEHNAALLERYRGRVTYL